MDLCSWTNVNLSAFKWLPSTGSDAHWIGGPKKDQTDGNKNGGYAFFETSQLPNSAEAANTVNFDFILCAKKYITNFQISFLKRLRIEGYLDNKYVITTTSKKSS